MREYMFWRAAHNNPPHLYTKVLVYRKYFAEYGNKITIGQLIAGYGNNPPQWEDLSGRQIYPNFWMPLPEPPQE